MMAVLEKAVKKIPASKMRDSDEVRSHGLNTLHYLRYVTMQYNEKIIKNQKILFD